MNLSMTTYFSKKRVRYARADELELFGSNAPSPVKRRDQPMSSFYYSCWRIVDG